MRTSTLLFIFDITVDYEILNERKEESAFRHCDEDLGCQNLNNYCKLHVEVLFAILNI